MAVGASDKSKSGGMRALLNDEHMHVSCAHVVRASCGQLRRLRTRVGGGCARGSGSPECLLRDVVRDAGSDCGSVDGSSASNAMMASPSVHPSSSDWRVAPTQRALVSGRFTDVAW